MDNKDRDYWLERGKKFSQKEGFICLGNGDGNDSLVAQEEKFRGNIWMEDIDDFDNIPSYVGNRKESIYYIKTEKFNQIFPMKTKEEELDELLAKAEKLKQEIEAEKKKCGIKVGDLVFAKHIDNESKYLFRVSNISNSKSGFWGDYYDLKNNKHYERGFFHLKKYEFTKIDL